MAGNDAYIEILSPGSVSGTKAFSFGSQPTKFSSGFYKIILMWVKCLLTAPGTDLSDLSYGTLLGSAVGGNVGSQSELQDIVVLSINTATAKIKEYQSRQLTLTSPETLSSVEVVDLSIPSPDIAKITVRLRNAAGELMLARLPFDVRVSR